MFQRLFIFLVFFSFVQLTGFTQNKTKTIQKQKAEIENRISIVNAELN